MLREEIKGKNYLKEFTLIKPTWQDKGRRIILVPSVYINFDDPLQFSTEKDHGNILLWNERKVTIKLDNANKSIEVDHKNLFWEDGKPDFDELRSLEELRSLNHEL